MMRLQDRSEQFRLLNDSGFPHKTGWLRAGIVSLLLHALLIVFFVFGLNATYTKGGPSIYRVTLRTLSPQQNFSPSPTHESVPKKTQIQGEEYKSMQEIKQKERAFDKKYLGQKIPSPIQRVVTRIPMEEQKQIPQHQEKEEAVERPIPLPIGAVSASNIDLSFETEDDLSIPLPHSALVEQYQNTIPRTGQGSGQGGSGWGGSGIGSGQEGSGWEGSRKGAGSGKEVPVEHGLETTRDREEAVLVGEDQELGDLVCLTPDTLKIQNLSILWKPGRKDTRGKFC